MKIQDAGQKAQIIQYVNQHAKAAEKNQTAAGSGISFSPMDRVELSSSSRLIQKIQEAAQAAPDIRAEKVAELKKKIANGTYQVSPADIAGKMLKDILIELNK